MSSKIVKTHLSVLYCAWINYAYFLFLFFTYLGRKNLNGSVLDD